MKLLSPFGNLVVLSISCGVLLIVSWTIVAITSAKHYLDKDAPNSAGSHHVNRADFNKLPRLSADKKTLVVTSEEALPNAFEFLKLNMYLPIQKIVLMKPGMNDTVRVYPIPRDSIIGMSSQWSVSISEIALILLFILFIIGSFSYIFSTMGSTKVFWDEEAWLTNDDLSLCMDPNDDMSGDDAEYEKLLINAEKKRKEIENI